VATKKRSKRKNCSSKYDSRLEQELHKKELKGFEYHPKEKIYYEVPHSYEPDFKTALCMGSSCRNSKQRPCGSCKELLIEVKGRFRERKEATKYIYVREALKENQELIFLFQDANKPMPFAKKRRDGTKQTHGEWAEKNGFRFFCLKKGLPKSWLDKLK